jgi:putative peptide zinc metalloprotease protein
VTSAGYELPRLRPEVVLGPPLRSGPTVVHHVKDPATGHYYRIGPREYFIMRRMDGTHTLDDISREYADTYDRRLGQDSWGQMFTLLGSRQLLDGLAENAALARLKAEYESKQPDRGMWFQKRWVLLRPDSLCTTLARRFRFALHPAFVVPVLLVAVALQVFVWSHVPMLLTDASHRTAWPITVPVSLTLVWAITAAHELAHGVTCKHFGGSVAEIGVRWRFPMIAAYCRTDDIVLFHRRSARVATAFAGVFVSMVALLPVVLLWWLTSGWPLGHSLAAGLLLFGSLGAMVNLMPFLQLDGYAMLGHTLDMADLKRECVKFWRLRLSRTPERRERMQAYPARDVWIYTLYGVVSLLFLGSAYSLLMWLWYDSLQGSLGSLPTILVLVAETALVAGLMKYAARVRAARALRKVSND